MPIGRFRIRTIMIVIAVAAVAMGLFRLVPWVFRVFTSELIFDFASVVASIPTVLLVEFLFLALLLLFRKSQV